MNQTVIQSITRRIKRPRIDDKESHIRNPTNYKISGKLNYFSSMTKKNLGPCAIRECNKFTTWFRTLP